jgi:hypothetical protein
MLDRPLVYSLTAGDKLVSNDICGCRFVKLIGDEGWGEE